MQLWFGHSCSSLWPLQPIVRTAPGPPSFAPKIFAIIIGEIYVKPIYLPSLWKSLITTSTSSNTIKSLPYVSKLERFFVIPKPPGIKRASKFSAFKSSIGKTSPRAIFLDSSRIFLSPSLISPFKWLITCNWFLLGAKHWTCAF